MKAVDKDQVMRTHMDIVVAGYIWDGHVDVHV